MTYDLADGLRGGADVNHALVDAHLVAVEGLGTLAVRRALGGDAEVAGGHAGGASNLDLLGARLAEEVGDDYIGRRGKWCER